MDKLCTCAYSQDFSERKWILIGKNILLCTSCVKRFSTCTWIKMTKKLFWNFFDSDSPYVTQMWQFLIVYVYPIINSIRLWFSVRLPFTNAWHWHSNMYAAMFEPGVLSSPILSFILYLLIRKILQGLDLLFLALYPFHARCKVHRS